LNYWEENPKTHVSEGATELQGVVGIEAIVNELLAIGFDGPKTLEIAGEEAVKLSAERLGKWSGS